MNWEIFSIGDARYLTTVLNAVAIMTGGADFKTIASIGFLLGLILTGFQGLMGGAREFKLQTFVVSLVVYFCMFGPRVTVSITDVYSDQVYQVDNTPLGLAAFGTITSGITATITKQIEGTFALPTMFEGGFVGSLRTLLGGRSLRTLSPKASTNGNPTGWPYQDSLENSISNYVRDCIQVAIKRGVINEKQLLSAPDMWAVMQFPSDVFGTVLPLYPPQGDNISSDGYEATCTRAYQDISNRFNDTNFQQAFEQQAAVIFGKEPQLKIQAALNTFGQGTFTSITGDAQAFMMNNVLHYLYERGWRESLAAEGRAEEALMISTAASQRDIQWAGESNMFVQVARPMIAFFEGLVYSLAPFMAFLIGFGSFGLTMVAKYLLLGLWVQIMPPVMALVNLYFNFAAQDEFKAVIDAGTEITSVYGMMEMYPSLNRWIGMAGLLGASVPAISMMLLYGSSVAATSMAGRLQGGDHLNEKIAAPDAFQPAAAVSARSAIESDAFKGTMTSMAPQLLTGAGAASTLKSLNEQSVSASETANSTLGHAVSSYAGADFSSKEGVERLRELGATARSSNVQSLASVATRADSFAKEFGIEKGDRDVLTGMLVASAGLKGSLSGKASAGAGGEGTGAAVQAALGLDAGVSGQTSEQRQMTLGEVMKNVNREGRDISRDGRFSADLGNEVMQKVADRSRTTNEKALSEGSRTDFKSQYDAAQSAQRSVRESESAERTFGLSQNVSGEVLAAQVGRSQAAMGAMQMLINNPDPMLNDYPLKSEYQSQYQHLRPHFDNDNTAKAAAFFSALNNVAGHGTDQQNVNRAAVLTQVLGSAGFAKPPDHNLENSDLWQAAPDVEQTRSAATAGLANQGSRAEPANGTAERVEDKVSAQGRRIEGGTTAAQRLSTKNTGEFFKSASQHVSTDHGANLGAANAKAFHELRDDYMSGGELNTLPNSLWVAQQFRNVESTLGDRAPDWMSQGYNGVAPGHGKYTDDMLDVKRHLAGYAGNTLDLGPMKDAYALGVVRPLDDEARGGMLGINLGNDLGPTFSDDYVARAKETAVKALSDDGKGTFADKEDQLWAERVFDDVYKAAAYGENGTKTLGDIQEGIAMRMKTIPRAEHPYDGDRHMEGGPTAPPHREPNMNSTLPVH